MIIHLTATTTWICVSFFPTFSILDNTNSLLYSTALVSDIKINKKPLLCMYIILLIHLISICTGFLDILPHKNILGFDILLLGDPKTVFFKITTDNEHHRKRADLSRSKCIYKISNIMCVKILSCYIITLH